MIGRSEALAAARSFIAERFSGGHDLVVIDGDTIEHELGWVFFVESDRYLKSRQFADKVVVPPLLVDRRAGRVQLLATGQPVVDSLEEYARWRDAQRPSA